MYLPSQALYRMIIIALGISGFFVAKHIRNHKTKNTPLVCPINFDCHTVVHSDYSKFFNMPVEVLGMIYYSFVVLSQLVFAVFPQVAHTSMTALSLVTSLVALLFSAYLIGVQIFVLKKGCSWCIVSALISALIFALTMIK